MYYKNYKLVLYIRANSAKTGPPLGTTLGNIGVNTANFCKEFNDFTKDLPNYLLLKVNINITENKSVSFTVSRPPIGSIISLLKKEEIIKDEHGVSKQFSFIMLEDFIKLAMFIFPDYDLKKSLKIIKGSLLSANIIIK
jgi:large subunit ribosomal protein L11